MSSSKVILMGGNHHNGLGLVRSFGRHGIKPYGIIIGKGANHNSFVSKSKYWEKVWLVRDEADALTILVKMFQNEELKPVLIPWSDGAAELIDLNFDMLKERYILPSINQEQGNIVKLMNKENQVEYANRYGLSMLPSAIIQLKQIKLDIPFPVIMKPVSSIEGGKNDMSICLNASDFNVEIQKLKEKGFTRILVQKYLETRTEYVITGAISSKRFSFTAVRHIRQWPLNFGTGSFSETVNEKNINDFCEHLLSRIQESGYKGTIDFELFESESGELFLNEINWRSSGRNFISKVIGIDSAYMYYCDETGVEYSPDFVEVEHIYSMNEVTDIKHVLQKDLSFSQWLSDFRRTKSFAVWDAMDPKPAFKRYGIMIAQFIKAM